MVQRNVKAAQQNGNSRSAERQRNDGNQALGFFEDGCPNKNNKNSNSMGTMGTDPDPKIKKTVAGAVGLLGLLGLN